jgi:hypothetical protein
MFTYADRLETMLATKVVETLLTPPSTAVATPAKLLGGRRRQNKPRESRKPHVRLIGNWLTLILNLCMHGLTSPWRGADDEGLNSHGDLPLCSPSDSILERDLSGERVFINPP